MNRLVLFMWLFFLLNFANGAAMPTADEKVRAENIELQPMFDAWGKFYDLPPGVDNLDITDKVLDSTWVKDSDKQLIRQNHRRIIVFTYPSDGLQIKGAVSFVPDPENHPLIVVLRGGNRTFGVPNPGNDLMNTGQYTGLVSLYRGGLSEGTDEFGGADVNDVKNLIDYIPQLEQKLGVHIQANKRFLIGSSRGGMEMFLALTRFPELQTYFSKAVSLSGLLDLQQTIQDRPDLKEMFIKDYGFQPGINEDAWIQQREPLQVVDKIDSKFPILIVQGTHDIRIGAPEAEHMVAKLHEAGKNATFLEVEGDHCLCDNPERMQVILDWLLQK